MAYLGGFDLSTSLRTSEVRCWDYTTQQALPLPHLLKARGVVSKHVCGRAHYCKTTHVLASSSVRTSGNHFW